MNDVEIIENKLDALRAQRAALARELETANESLVEARERLITAPDKRATDTATVAQSKVSMLQGACAEVDERVALLETQLGEAQAVERAEATRARIEALQREREVLQTGYNELRAELNGQLERGAARLRELGARHSQASREMVELTPGANARFADTRLREESLFFGEAIITALQIVQHEEDRLRIKASLSARSTNRSTAA
jgi:chromosome segregation ATPase